MISGIDQPTTIEDKLIQQLELAKDTTDKKKKIDYIKDQIGSFNKDTVNDKRILTAPQITEDDFKQLCHDNLDQIIYWINWKSGKFIWQELYNPRFYCDRELKYQDKIVIKHDIREQLVRGDPISLFIFSGIENEQEFIKSLKIPEQEQEKQEQQVLGNIANGKIILKNSEDDAKDRFQKLSKYDDKPVHWLKVEEIDGKQFIWQHSHGSLNELRKYIDKDKSKTSDLKESQFAQKVKDKEAILIDEPGMGKSTTLTKLSEKKLDSNWVIRINLKDCQDVIKRLALDSEVITMDKAVKFLLETGNFVPSTDLTIVKGLLQYKLSQVATSNSWPLLLLFDGFDEIKSDSKGDKGKVSLLLKFLKDKATVWVTARKHATETLQNSLSIFNTEFKEFIPAEQKEFLKNFWMLRLSLTLSQKELIKVFPQDSSKDIENKSTKEKSKFERYSEALFKGMDKKFLRKIMLALWVYHYNYAY